MGFPCDSVVKNQVTNAVGTKDEGLIPGLGRSTGEGNGNKCSCLGNPIPWTEEPGGLHFPPFPHFCQMVNMVAFGVEPCEDEM